MLLPESIRHHYPAFQLIQIRPYLYDQLPIEVLQLLRPHELAVNQLKEAGLNLAIFLSAFCGLQP